MTIKGKILVLAVIAAAMFRIIPHAPNFTPIGALALFGAAYFDRKAWAFIVPALAIFISSLFINNVLRNPASFVWFDGNFVSQVLGFAAITLMGLFTLKKVKVSNVLISSLSASLLFFLISNFGEWTTGLNHPVTGQGLIECYVTAIPFFWNTLAGDLVYCAALFGGYELARRQIPALARA